MGLEFWRKHSSDERGNAQVMKVTTGEPTSEFVDKEIYLKTLK